MKVYGFSEPNQTGYVRATAYICGDGEEITWSPRGGGDGDYMLTHEEMAAHCVPRSVKVRCWITRAAAATMFDDPDVKFDIASELLADMYPKWSAMLGDNVMIYDHECVTCSDPECISDHEGLAWAPSLVPAETTY